MHIAYQKKGLWKSCGKKLARDLRNDEREGGHYPPTRVGGRRLLGHPRRSYAFRSLCIRMGRLNDMQHLCHKVRPLKWTLVRHGCVTMGEGVGE